MRHPWLALVALVAVLGIAGSAYFLLTTRSLAPEQAAPRAAEQPAASAVEGAPVVPDSLTPAEDEPQVAASERTEAEEQAPEEWDPAETVWLDVQVELPAQVPPGDDTQVLAFRERQTPDELAREIDRLDPDAKPKSGMTRAPVGPDGTARLGLPPNARRVHIAVSGNYTYSEKTSAVATDAGPVRLVARLGAHVSGRLVPPADATEEERLLAGLEIEFERDPMGRMGFSGLDGEDPVDQRRAKTRDDFTFEIRGVAPDLRYRLEFRPAQLSAALGEWVTPAAGEDLVLDTLLTRGGTLRGRVVDEQGAAVAGAELEARQEAIIFGQGGMLVREGESQADGTFALKAVRPGTTRVTAELAGRLEASANAEVVEGRDSEVVEIVLGLGNKIAGRVTWADGALAAEVEVAVSFDLAELAGMGAFSAMRGASGSGKTDAEGRFEVTGLGSGPFLVMAQSERKSGETSEKGSARISGVKPNTSDLALVLELPLSARGRVVDDRGEPLTAFRVYAAQAGGGLMNLGAETQSESVEDDEGRFELAGLRAGVWKFGAEAPGHGESAPVEVTLPHAEAIEIVLPRAATVRGIVLSPSGVPIAGARVAREMSMQELGQVATRRAQIGGAEAQGVSDAEGRFEVKNLPSGSHSMIATLEGHAASAPVAVMLEPASAVEGVELRLRIGGHLFGEVFDDQGKPDAGTTILAQIPSAFTNQRWSSTDAEGKFEFEHMTPGTWQVMTMFGRDTTPTAGDPEQDLSNLMSQLKFAMVDIVDDEETHVVLGAPPEDPVRVHGVVSLDGEPLGNVFLTFFPDARDGGSSGMQDMRFNSTDGEGAYSVKLDKPGRYLVSVQRVGTMGAQQSLELNFDIPKAEEHRLDIALPTAGIAGRVLDSERRPIPSARVSLARDGAIKNTTTFGGRYSEMTADAEGNFAIDWLESGTYVLAAGGAPMGGLFGGTPTHARQVLSGLSVGKGEWLRDVEFRLQSPGVIAGKVLDQDGKPVQGAGLFVRDEAGQVLDRISMCTSDASGNFRYEGLAMGQYTVGARDLARASEFSPAVSVRTGETSEVTLRLEGGTMLLVSVQTEEGAFLEADLSVTDDDGRQVNGLFSFEQLMAMASKGGFSTAEQRVGPLPAGRYKVTATTSDGRTRSKPVTLSGQEERKINIRIK